MKFDSGIVTVKDNCGEGQRNVSFTVKVKSRIIIWVKVRLKVGFIIRGCDSIKSQGQSQDREEVKVTIWVSVKVEMRVRFGMRVSIRTTTE